MARELRVGDRVRTLVPLWDDRVRMNAREIPTGLVARVVRVWEAIGGIPCVGLLFDGEADNARALTASPHEVEPLPADIPRERVADLHAAVRKRLAQLCAACDITQPDDLAATCAAQRWSELSEVAEALRLLLEVDDAD